MTQILIYQDYVYNNGGLFKTLSQHYGQNNILFMDAEDIKNGVLTEQVAAFIMPGGASRYVSDKLNGAGNKLIKDYVAQGGLYIGICAGAYYGCQQTKWQPAIGPAFMLENELGFFPGIAKGPARQFCLDNIQHIATITPLITEHGERYKTLYWDGPLFEATEKNYNIHARYTDLPDHPAAVISGYYKKGRYLLCSPHLELNAELIELMRFDVPDNRFAEIAALPHIDNLNHSYFISLLTHFIGQ
jgi:glutamine amidotransferase-like uncharacterized protein